MTATQSDTTDTQPATKRRRTPRPRTAPAAPAEPAATAPGHARAVKAFEVRAQDWLLGRPGRLVELPHDLDAVARAVGVPCRDCGALIYRHGDAGHSVEWTRVQDQHWAAGITASCK